jgi:hypothetical protein
VKLLWSKLIDCCKSLFIYADFYHENASFCKQLYVILEKMLQPYERTCVAEFLHQNFMKT